MVLLVVLVVVFVVLLLFGITATQAVPLDVKFEGHVDTQAARYIR